MFVMVTRLIILVYHRNIQKLNPWEDGIPADCFQELTLFVGFDKGNENFWNPLPQFRRL